MDCGCSERISVPLRKDLFLLFSCSYSLWLHRLQHARLLYSLLSRRVCSHLSPLNWWYYLTISSSATCFPSCPQSFPASGSFQMSQLLAAGGQSTGVSALASVFLMNTQDWSLKRLVGSPCSSRDSEESSPTPQSKTINSSVLSLLHSPTLTSIHDHRKNHSLD